MIKITIQRKNQPWHHGKIIHVYANKKKLGTVFNGCTDRFTIDDDQVELFAVTRILGSNKVLLTNSESNSYNLKLFVKCGFACIYLFGLIVSSIVLLVFIALGKYTFFTFVIFGLLILLMGILLVLGRRKFFFLGE